MIDLLIGERGPIISTSHTCFATESTGEPYLEYSPERIETASLVRPNPHLL